MPEVELTLSTAPLVPTPPPFKEWGWKLLGPEPGAPAPEDEEEDTAPPGSLWVERSLQRDFSELDVEFSVT